MISGDNIGPNRRVTQKKRPVSSEQPSPKRTDFVWQALVLLTLFVIGLSKFADPLGGDQSLFLIGAHAIRNGATLYRDFWDLKQPGIYVFYYLATAFGSYSPIAVHFFELSYMLVFALVQMLTLRTSHTFRSVANIAPIMTIGYYFISVGSFEQAQVESLVAFPLYVASWCTYAGSRTDHSRKALGLYFIAGLASAIVLIFKFIFLPLLVIVLVLALYKSHKHFFTYIRAFGTIAIGVALPLLGMLIYFATRNALSQAIETWFALPPRIVAELPHESTTILWGGIRWFVHRFAGLFFLALLGMYSALRTRPDGFAIATLAWLICGIGVILLQVTSWFQYQWLLIATPLGLFAALGVHTAGKLASAKSPWITRLLVTIVIGLSFLVPATLLFKNFNRLAAHKFALTPLQREQYRDDESQVYAACRRDAAYLTAERSSVYVLGDPTFYVVAHRLQPFSLNGSSVRLFLPEQWAQLQRELLASPPSAVYISHSVTIASLSLRDLISHRYAVRHRGTNGDLLFLK